MPCVIVAATVAITDTPLETGSVCLMKIAPRMT